MNKKFLFVIALTAFAILSVPVLAAAPRPAKFPVVSGLAVRQVGTGVVVSWGKPGKNMRPFDGYTVFRSEKSGKLGQDTGHIPKDKRSFTDMNVIAGHTYYYSVRYYSRQPFTPVNGRQVKIKIKVSAVKPTPTPGASLETPRPASQNAPPFSAPLSLPAASSPSTAQSDSGTGVNSVSGPVVPPAEQPNIFSNATPNVAPVVDAAANSNDIKRITTLKQLQVALAQYFSAQGSYPSGNALVIGAPQTDCLNSDGWGASGNCPYPYFSSIPADPGNSDYVYTASAGSYTITVTLQGVVSGLSGTVAATPAGITKK